MSEAAMIATLAWKLWAEDRLYQAWAKVQDHASHPDHALWEEEVRYWLASVSQVQPKVDAIMRSLSWFKRRHIEKQAIRVVWIVARQPSLGLKPEYMEKIAEHLLQRLHRGSGVRSLLTGLLAGF